MTEKFKISDMVHVVMTDDRVLQSILHCPGFVVATTTARVLVRFPFWDGGHAGMSGDIQIKDCWWCAPYELEHVDG